MVDLPAVNVLYAVVYLVFILFYFFPSCWVGLKFFLSLVFFVVGCVVWLKCSIVGEAILYVQLGGL